MSQGTETSALVEAMAQYPPVASAEGPDDYLPAADSSGAASLPTGAASGALVS